MKIIIAGTGDTAVHLAKMLSRESQDVVVMGRDSDVLDRLDRGYNLLTFHGNPVIPSDLRGAGATGCDLFIAVTPYENHNLISAQLAKWLGAKRTLARIDNAELTTKEVSQHFVSLGVDTLVYPEMLASHEILRALSHPWLRAIYPLHSGAMTAGAVRIEKGSPIDGTMLRDFDKTRYGVHVCAIRRDGETIIPRGDDSIRGQDIVYFTTSPDADEATLMQLCGKPQRSISNVIVAGAGKMTRAVVELIQDKFDVTVIDPDRELCERLASNCRRATVVCADFRDVDVLREEGIKHCNAFIALSDSAEKNIVCAHVARTLGAQYTITQIEDIQYFAEADDLGLDVVINKKLLSSSAIYQMLLDSYLHSPRCLAFEEAEVAEIVAKENSAITRRPIKDLRLDRAMTIAAVVHQGHGALVSGDTRICAGDSVVIFCLRGHLHRIQSLFT